MEKIEILILTSVVVVLFIVFAIATYREFAIMGKQPNKYQEDYKLKGKLSRSVKGVTKKKKTPKVNKETIYKSMNRTIADMESEGIYFPEEIKDRLRQQRNNLKNENL